eukprot:11228322-Lingulodinium_polyedra.AAC.2
MAGTDLLQSAMQELLHGEGIMGTAPQEKFLTSMDLSDEDISAFQKELNNAAAEESTESSQHDRQPIPGNEKYAEQLKSSLEHKNIPTRSPLGQKFTEHLRRSPLDAQAYESIKAAPGEKITELKNNFRLRWAAAQYEKVTTVTHVETHEWQDIDEESGCYEPLERIIELEGGRQYNEAVRAALRYVMKARAMGGKWVMWNPMTERCDILYIKKTCKKIFSTKWSIFKKHALEGPGVHETGASSAAGAAGDAGMGPAAAPALGLGPAAAAAATSASASEGCATSPANTRLKSMSKG